jgi:Tol biopolymer transport system component/tRNA A-37 threonylcarbamoyl transferase component Bud32
MANALRGAASHPDVAAKGGVGVAATPYDPGGLVPDPTARLRAAVGDRYAVERVLGEGGMATVYLAEDLRHRRKVAIKVLKPELAAAVGADRFLKEIRTTAALQHPHILPLHDSGEAEGLLYYVMPYVEGESLRERLERERQLPVEEALGIASAVAQGLAVAHESGVVHRDIKPANILLGRGGPFIADFGIATAHTLVGGERLTETGLSLGTPGYMSPEQVTGDNPVDGRSDAYSLGCVLFEMLVGEAPYSGSSAQAVIARILSGEVPSARARRAAVPLHVDAVIRRAIERLPADRFSSCTEMSEALADPSFRHGVDLVPEVEEAVRAWRRGAFALGLTAVALLGAWLWTWLGPVAAPERPITRFAVSVPESEGYAAGRQSVNISPDGRHVAFVGQGQGRGGARLFVRSLAELEPWVVPGSAGALDPFFSPDGQWLGYATVDGLMKVPLAGGPPERIIGFAEPRGIFWADDDRIFFGSYSGLWSVGADGEGLEQITSLRTDRGELAHTRPELLPGGEVALFTLRGAGGETEVASVRLGGDEIRTHLRGLSPHYASTGHLLFGLDDGTLMAVRFDPASARVTGVPEPVLSGVVVKPGAMEYGLSRDGTLAYLAGAIGRGTLVLVDRSGQEQDLLETDDEVNAPRFSPDGDRLAVGVGTPPNRQVWVYEMAQGTMAPITYEGHNYYGIWSPDGSRITFARETGTSVDLFSKPSDGSGTAEPVLQNGHFNYPEAWTPDGAALVIREQDADGGHDLYALDMKAGGVPRPLRNQPAQEESPTISPDGRWLAYASDVSGEFEVYVTAFPTPGGRTQVSVRGGSEPVWAPGGSELLYWRADTLVAATMETEDRPRVVARRDLFVGTYSRWPFHRNYDVHPDGRRFVMIRPRDTRSQQLVLAENWAAALGNRGGMR